MAVTTDYDDGKNDLLIDDKEVKMLITCITWQLCVKCPIFICFLCGLYLLVVFE